MRRIIGPCACGSLQPDLHPGTFVVCDQFVDRTSGRADTFYDGRRPSTCRPPTRTARTCAGCSSRRATELGIRGRGRRDGGRDPGPALLDEGRIALVLRRRAGTVVNMTQYPEAWLARELELCYATVALVTDYDVGLEGMPDVEPVTAEAAFRVFAENLARLRDLLFRAIPRIGPQPEDVCATALASAIVH